MSKDDSRRNLSTDADGEFDGKSMSMHSGGSGGQNSKSAPPLVCYRL